MQLESINDGHTYICLVMLTLESTYRVRKVTFNSQKLALVHAVLTLSHREDTSQSSPIKVLTIVLWFNHLFGSIKQSTFIHLDQHMYQDYNRLRKKYP